MSEMVLIVAGSQGFVGALRWARAFTMLDALLKKYPAMRIVVGGAPGADACGEWWARNRGLARDNRLRVMPANWYPQGPRGPMDRGAGHKRNAEMAAVGTHLIAFWDGTSPGTKGMIDIATRKFGAARVHVVKYLEWT